MQLTSHAGQGFVLTNADIKHTGLRHAVDLVSLRALAMRDFVLASTNLFSKYGLLL